jgi:uncharacterized membrane protein
METEERLNRLEQRLTVLEGLVRQLLGQTPIRRPASGTAGQMGGGAASESPAVASAPIRSPRIEPVEPRKPREAVDSEQWFGQRGLLGVGVIFLILAAGYLLKLSFDRGWVSPAARCIGGAIAGLVVGALGFRLHRKGLVTYGAALIGCGAAIVYLAVWAASRLYQFLPPTTGIAALALVSLSLAAVAYVINVQALGSTAALGAFFAPLLLGSDSTDANILLLYLGFMGLSLGWVAAVRRWRMTMLVVGASYFGLVVGTSYFGLVSADAWRYSDPHALLAYALLGGCAGLYVGLREGWWETRVLSFGGGWSLLGLANQNIENHWLILAGAVVLAAPIWGRALYSNRIWPAKPSETDPVWSPGESFYFYLTPLLLAWAVYQVAPARFDLNGGLLPLIIAVPYLLAGFTAERIRFALVGTTAVLIAALLQWEGLTAAWALLGAALLWTTLDRLLQRWDGRWYGLVAAATALFHLLYVDLAGRTTADPAFVGSYALPVWATTITLALFAAGLWRHAPEEKQQLAGSIPGLCWTAAGLILLLGVTAELRRYFLQSGMPEGSASLAGGLSVSAWWILFAAGLVLLGFRRGVKPVRVAGLVVAGMAVLKVVLFDLSGLDALYRVGSVLILGLVSLGLAYIYNRRAQSGEPEGSSQ